MTHIPAEGRTACGGGGGQSGNHRIEISVDRLRRIPTDELTFLAERFHLLTVRMYEELCARRTAERRTAGVTAMPHDQNGSAA